MKSLTIAFITSRKEPQFQWFLDSLHLQVQAENERLFPEREFPKEHFPKRPSIDYPKIMRVDSNLDGRYQVCSRVCGTDMVDSDAFPPKPTIWQGKHRITKEDWWAKSNAMNTAIILCTTDYLAMVDDRCVLAPEWLQCVFDAMRENYAVVGSYEKRANMKVENGVITDMGEDLGQDTRPQYGNPVSTHDWYGGSCALPLEWCLQVNGFAEIADGLGSEDSLFGITLRNSGLPMKFDSRMRLIEDRTPSEIGGALKRADKGVDRGRNAKSWVLLRIFNGKTDSQNEYCIRNMRDRVLLNNENLWEMPTYCSKFDYYDGQPISEME